MSQRREKFHAGNSSGRRKPRKRAGSRKAARPASGLTLDRFVSKVRAARALRETVELLPAPAVRP
jgi:hypothetical protein